MGKTYHQPRLVLDGFEQHPLNERPRGATKHCAHGGNIPKLGKGIHFLRKMEMGTMSKIEGADDCGRLKTYLELVTLLHSSMHS